jgi:signal transduction histidine kinase
VGTGAPSPSGEAREALARAVHDLCGPLTVIRGLCAVLGRDEPRPDRRRGLALIDGEALRLATGLQDLLRLAVDGAERRRGAVALGSLVASVVERHSAVAAARGLRLTARAAGEPLTVRGDADELLRALDNLVQNALRHCTEGGEVRVAVSRRGPRAHVRVRDEGPGVAARDRDRIFRPGERGSAPRGAGRGLGLAIARGIAEAHGGRLTLDPVGPGACFRLTLPLHQVAAPEPSAA